MLTSLWRPAKTSVAYPHRGGLGLPFGNAHVSLDFVFPDLIDHQLQRRPGSAHIKEDGLIDGSVLLLQAQVIHVERHGELLLFNIGAPKLDHDIADLRTIALAVERELSIIALAHAAEFIDLIMIAGDQSAEFGAGHLEIVPRRRQIALHASEIEIGRASCRERV